MPSFWEKKIANYFKRIDFDKDGVITKGDFTGMADKFAKDGKLSAERSTQLSNSLINVWKALVEEVGGGESITEATLTDALRKRKDDAELKKTLAQPLESFFEAVDANNDDFIDAGEFEEFYVILGADCVSHAKESFAIIDTNHDGKLSREEFVSAGVDYLCQEDEGHNSKVFWGPF